jgi:hypothetical protein
MLKSKTDYNTVDKRQLGQYITHHELTDLLENKRNFSLNNWSAVQSLLTILVMAVAGIAWGLKLENRIDSLNSSYTSINTQISKGILPLADERINQIMTENTKMRTEIDSLQLSLQKLEVELARTRLGNVQITTKNK